MKQSNIPITREHLLVITLITAIFMCSQLLLAQSQDIKIVVENWKFYVLFPDGKKVEIVKQHEGGADNAAILSPDAKYVFYTDGTEIGFESSGKDLFCCKPDGTERTFLHKLYGSVQSVNWIKKKGHNYLLFLEVRVGEGEATIDLFDFDSQEMLLKMKGWGFERIGESDCFILKDELGNLKVDSKICLDSLLTLSNPDKYNIAVYSGYGYQNLLFLSIRREAFLDPRTYWPDVPNEEIAKIVYGGLGQCFPSPFGGRNAFCINMDTKSWIGVLNSKTNKFQFMDSLTTGKYGDNFVWSYDGGSLGFIKTYPEDYQEIVILEFWGDTCYVVKNNIKLKEGEEIELIGWSTQKNGFYYMIGKKEFLNVKE